MPDIYLFLREIQLVPYFRVSHHVLFLLEILVFLLGLDSLVHLSLLAGHLVRFRLAPLCLLSNPICLEDQEVLYFLLDPLYRFVQEILFLQEFLAALSDHLIRAFQFHP